MSWSRQRQNAVHTPQLVEKDSPWAAAACLKVLAA